MFIHTFFLYMGGVERARLAIPYDNGNCIHTHVERQMYIIAHRHCFVDMGLLW